MPERIEGDLKQKENIKILQEDYSQIKDFILKSAL
jgi:hypothetical protein